MNKKHIVGYVATGLVAFAIGSGTGGEPATTETAGPGAAGPGTTVTAAGSTATVTAPGVTRTVTAETVKTVTAGPPKPAVAMEGDGTYEVGVDVKPGTYVSTSPDSGNCYWARLTGSDGLDGIIDNGNSSGRVIVTIKQRDKFFQSNGCNDWTKR